MRKLGFEPRIIPAIYVKPFNKGQKNEYNDAEAIAEATLRPNLKTVSEKLQEQLDLQALHRVALRACFTADGDDEPNPGFSDSTRCHCSEERGRNARFA